MWGEFGSRTCLCSDIAQHAEEEAVVIQMKRLNKRGVVVCDVFFFVLGHTRSKSGDGPPVKRLGVASWSLKGTGRSSVTYVRSMYIYTYNH